MTAWVLVCTRDTLFSEDQVRFETNNVFTDLLDVLFLHLQNAGEVFLTSDLNISLRGARGQRSVFSNKHSEEDCGFRPFHLTFTLLVLQRAVQQNNSRVLDESSHTGMSNILIYHHTPQHTRVINDAARHLFTQKLKLGIFTHWLTFNHCLKSTWIADLMLILSIENKLDHVLVLLLDLALG